LVAAWLLIDDFRYFQLLSSFRSVIPMLDKLDSELSRALLPRNWLPYTDTDFV